MEAVVIACAVPLFPATVTLIFGVALEVPAVIEIDGLNVFLDTVILPSASETPDTYFVLSIVSETFKFKLLFQLPVSKII